MKLLNTYIVAISLLFMKTIHADECQEKCNDPRKEYKTCQSSSCIKTCTQQYPPCNTDDCVAGCFCKDDYYLNEKTNKCVTLEKCYKCHHNEVFKTCGTCDGTCDIPYPICTMHCRIGCFCETGHVRYHGICIPLAACLSETSASSASSS